ncbi:MAG: type II secretion system F family protein [Pirellulales bacterium]|nr:type II secretion system F family protein [Pirellulales bacterium]
MGTLELSPRRSGPLEFFRRLHQIKIGGSHRDPATRKTPQKDLIRIVSNLATLVTNGLSLPKALATIAAEPSLEAYADLLDDIRRKIEAGQAFSSALATYRNTFSDLMVYQIRVAERSGTVGETLTRITEQLENHSRIRSLVIKRLSYPAVVVIAGALVVFFMISFIVPVFQDTYAKAGVPLPWVTRALMAIADAIWGYGWIAPLALGLFWLGWKRMRRSRVMAARFDRLVLQLPVLGNWFRDLAVLQFVQVLGTMLESGFKVVDALAASSGSVSNAAVRAAVEQLHAAVVRGERLSRELERHGKLFPPVISQLVIVGEQTGKLSTTARHVVDHLRRQIERNTDVMVGAIEPVLTVGLAFAIGFVLMAIYLPMFDMISVIETK